MVELPDPLVSPDCDCTDLDGFMLNVERLMASELVALSTHEVVAAALFLWCRAWKQRPAASLPDDDRVLAAYSRLPLPRFRKLRSEILHGFVKCSDGRLYHRVLSPEATKAFERKMAFQAKRDADAKRLQEWRRNKKGTTDETPNETRFVPEGQGQDGTGTGRDRDLKKEEGFEPAAGVPAKKQKPKSKLPADWKPTPEQLEYARAQGCTDPHDTAERFRLHHGSRGTLGADWNLGFQYWCRNEKHFRSQSTSGGAGKPVKFN